LSRVTAFAACLCLIISAVVVAPLLRELDFSNWENAQYSAEDIAKIFNTSNYDSTTNAYLKKGVPNSKYLNISIIPNNKYLDTYIYQEPKHQLSEADFRLFVESLLTNFSVALNHEFSQYFIEESQYETNKRLTAVYDLNQNSYVFFAQQYQYDYYFTIHNNSNNGTIYLDGEAVQIEQGFSDNEIIASIEGIKNKLFDIFGVSFKDFKIVHRYLLDTAMVDIYFYDKDAHPLNLTQEKPVSDSICISFKNALSDNLLSQSIICYYKNRTLPTASYDVVSKQRMISIKEAEKLLYKGYVFGGHSCKLCMAEQDKISFEGYDFVDLEYVFEYVIDPTQASYGIPFYAFYKQIGTAENGNLIYAKTYVPAIKVRGYEEYFESQIQNHTAN